MLAGFYISLLYFSFGIVLCISFSSSQFKKNLLNEHTYSCSYQLWTNETEDACIVERLGLNNSECQSELSETPTRNIPQRGIIKIEPYKDAEGRRTAFNISAYNITWNNLKIRFQQQNTENCMKRLFTINKKIPKDAILFYDVPWATAGIEDTYIDFEYVFNFNHKYDGKRTFLIHVPKYEALKYFSAPSLKNVTLFTYVETTNLYQLICKIHTAPQHLSVTAYEINVYFRKNKNVTRIDGPFVKNVESAIFGVIDFEYDTYGLPGEYIFYVRPWNCSKCQVSMSPVVVIPESSTILTIGIVGVSCLIPIFLIILYMYFKVDSGTIPRVLLITTPANNAHKKIGKSLANLLIEKYNIPTMIDFQDIPTLNMLPSDWLIKSFKNTTHVIILISDDKPATSIYRNIDNLVYSLMQVDHGKICCTLEFPFTKKVNLKFRAHRNFKLMQDYNAFINFIHNRGLLRRLVKKVVRNDLYYDLVTQIDDYGNDKNCSRDWEETVSYNSSSSEDERNHKNEKNSVDEDQVVLPPDVANIVRICLENVNSSNSRVKSDDSDKSDVESSVKSDDSDDSDVEPSVNVQSLLKKTF